MDIGRFALRTVSGGRFRLDGGAMFGIVPKPLWSRAAAADDRNRIQLGTNCVLVECDAFRMLIDTGFGNRMSEKSADIHAAEPDGTLVGNLLRLGITPDQIDYVVLSHLHFDHAGGGTMAQEDGQLALTFPCARYLLQRTEWEAAHNQAPEWTGIYPHENVVCLEGSEQLELVDGDAEIAPGIRVILTRGHSPGHQAIVIEDDDSMAMYLGDMCPTWAHLPRTWCMAYDADTMEVRRRKPGLLGFIAEQGGWALSDHDPQYAAVKLQPDERRDFVVSETCERL